MNIILIGFMGSGKSSVATLLARNMNRDVVETDECVLSQSGRKNIKEIFLLDGEMKFRQMEIKVSKKLSARKNIIISTGGGMVINKICIDYLRKRGVVIYLKASFEEIVKRLKGDKSRPLFHDQLIAKKLFQFRHALYKEYADKEINTDGKSVEEVISSLLKIIRSQLG